MVYKGKEATRNEEDDIVEPPYFQTGMVADISYEGVYNEKKKYPTYGYIHDNNNNDGYNSWFVPKIDLLKQIVDNIVVQNMDYAKAFWSSTETNDYIEEGYWSDTNWVGCNPNKYHPQNKIYLQHYKQEGESVTRYINPCEYSKLPQKYNIIPVHKFGLFH